MTRTGDVWLSMGIVERERVVNAVMNLFGPTKGGAL